MVIRYIHPVKPSSAEGLVADIYTQIKSDFGKVVEPFELHSPLPKLLAGTWMACRETELAGVVPRVLKEAVAAAISNVNACSYCVDAHTIMLNAAGEKKAADAIIQNRIGDISNATLKQIVEWASAANNPKAPILLSPPFNRQEAPELIGTAVFCQYINRMVTILLGETPLPSNQPWLKGTLKTVASRIFQDAIKAPKKQGDSLRFLPKTSLPADLHWARYSPSVAWAYASFANVIEQIAEGALPLEVRVFVQEEINEWNGKTSELSLAWSEEKISRFSEAEQTAARLALFTALSPKKVDASIVSEFHEHFPTEDCLLGALAWASFAAARKTGTWLNVPPA